ncbi:general secretion pathway protein I [Idiomarina sp. A28L]|uniref:type II secretion system minor pseudopilin GspI n=1 Tax=Idiomarina sp. A28L TaxID=1036674 RepID=UPI00021385BE|nr:type II secretion system minor pseudopilin GspI [Idiomarina sp. A28L]EGN74717.1 general secretion pathway protein I [Idiomarina sp. A28L]
MVTANRGFTLVETMFALVIFSLAALAALNVATEQLRSTGILETRYFAQQVASNRLAQLHANTDQADWPPANEKSGSAQMAGSEWFWEQRVLETVTDDLIEVTVMVRERENGPVIVELSSYIGRR